MDRFSLKKSRNSKTVRVRNNLCVSGQLCKLFKRTHFSEVRATETQASAWNTWTHLVLQYCRKSACGEVTFIYVAYMLPLLLGSLWSCWHPGAHRLSPDLWSPCVCAAGLCCRSVHPLGTNCWWLLSADIEDTCCIKHSSTHTFATIATFRRLPKLRWRKKLPFNWLWLPDVSFWISNEPL